MNLILSEINFLNVNRTIDFFNSKCNNELKGEIFIENNDKILSLNSKKIFIKSYGELRFKEFLKKSSICSRFEFPNEVQVLMKELMNSINEENADSIKRILDKIYQFPFAEIYNINFVFSMAVWLLKDSCVQEKNTYFITNTGYINSTQINMPYTLANGDQKNVDLNDYEWLKVEEYFELLYPIMTKPLSEKAVISYHSNESFSIITENMDRSKESSFIRALISVQQARRNGQLSVKIDFYFQALQCIFALEGIKSTVISKYIIKICTNLLNQKQSDASSIATIISKSNKLILKKNSESNQEEQNTFKSILKKSFKIRSKQSHGNKINESKDEIINLAKSMDNLVRRVLLIVLKNPDLNYTTKKEAEKVADYFLKLEDIDSNDI